MHCRKYRRHSLICLLVASFALAGIPATTLASTPPRTGGLPDSINRSISKQERQTLRPPRGMPVRDMVMTYGIPLKKIEPVGAPPISRWIYPGYTVYLEGVREQQRVIHAVNHHRHPK